MNISKVDRGVRLPMNGCAVATAITDHELGSSLCTGSKSGVLKRAILSGLSPRNNRDMRFAMGRTKRIRVNCRAAKTSANCDAKSN